MATVAQTLTLEEFLALPDGTARQELNGGELVEMPPGTHGHSQVLHAFLFRLYEAAKKEGRFEARSETAYLVSADPPTVRVPDVSLVAVDRLRAAPPNAYIEGAPEVAIEVVSPSDTATDLNEKTRQYLSSGCWAVIVAYPKTKEVHVHRTGEPTEILGGDDALEIASALPGWSVRVGDLFGR